MHRSAASSAASGGSAEHLRHHRDHRYAAGQGVAVFAVGGHHGVVGAQRLQQPDRDGFLADVEVHESADLRGAVELDAALLETSDPHHLPQQLGALLGLCACCR